MLPKTCTPRCCGATDTDQSPQCFQVVYSTHPSGTGLTAHPGIRPSQADWVPPCLCCSQGSWAPGEGSSEAQTDTQPLPVPVPILQDPSPCPAEAGGHPGVGGGLWPSGGVEGEPHSPQAAPQAAFPHFPGTWRRSPRLGRFCTQPSGATGWKGDEGSPHPLGAGRARVAP